MADWPESEEIKKVLDVDADGSDDWTDTIDRIRSAAIDRVTHDVGEWDESEDEPDEALAQAALRMAELIAQRPEVAKEGTKDPTYWALLKGHRRRFAIS